MKIPTFIIVIMGSLMMVFLVGWQLADNNVETQAHLVKQYQHKSLLDKSMNTALNYHMELMMRALEECHAKLPFDSLAEADSKLAGAYADYVWDTAGAFLDFETWKRVVYNKEEEK